MTHTTTMSHTNGDTVNAIKGHIKPANISSRLYSIPSDSNPDISHLLSLCSQETKSTDLPHSSAIQSNIPIYDLATFSPYDTSLVSTLQDEWHSILHTGPGVYILKHCYSDLSLIDRVTFVFNTIITSESSSSASNSKGDHFAPTGHNARIWNSFQKHALSDPASFLSYYSNPWLAIASESWLGPAYQITAQVNLVRPGGKPQMPHRDYHLGFQTVEACVKWPRTMHHASQFLTLQGAVAHEDMPLESGPTRFLPYSQLCEDGYMLWRTDAVKRYFDENWVSVSMEKGDAVFFNPALFHAAGENRSENVQRCANLLQVSSAFGKTMETVDCLSVVEACWDDLRRKAEREGVESLEVVCTVKAMSLGYPFPTNLDKRPPAPGGMAPESESELVRRALREAWSREQVMKALRQMRLDSQA